MISIIISGYQNSKYLIRCLNSIKRQSYKDWEIICIEKDYSENIDLINAFFVENFSEAIKHVSGEYCFFCNATTVLSPNTLEILSENCTDEKVIVSGKLLVENDGCYNLLENGLIFYDGKLIPTTLFKESSVKNEKNIDKIFHMLDILTDMNYTVNVVENVYIYETEKKVFDIEFETEKKDQLFSDFIHFYFKIAYKEQLEPILLTLVDCEINEKIILNKIIDITKCGNNTREFIYILIDKYIDTMFKESLLNDDEEKYDQIKKILSNIENDALFFNVVLQKMDLNKKQYEYMCAYPLKEFLFFKDKIIDEKEYDIKDILKRLADNELRLEKLEKTSMQNEPHMIESENKNVENLSSPILADYIVEKYRNGELGLSTIIKALRAWITYKFKN